MNYTERRKNQAEDAQSSAAKPAIRHEGHQGADRKMRILIVEDEPAMVAGLRDNFEFEGYEVVSAADGVAGLERALADDPDLVVLDVMMPRMSGLDVCKQLRAKRPSLPIIMLNSTWPGDRQGCRPRTGRRRLHHQAILHSRADGAGESNLAEGFIDRTDTGDLLLR
jgi:CheY-like chemotaxis protein